MPLGAKCPRGVKNLLLESERPQLGGRHPQSIRQTPTEAGAVNPSAMDVLA